MGLGQGAEGKPGAPHQPVGPLLVLPPQIVDAHEEAVPVVADHFPDLARVNPLVFLQEGWGENTQKPAYFASPPVRDTPQEAIPTERDSL